MSEFFLQLFCKSNLSYSIIIEDDKGVAYAYLMEKDNIIGDVWLYNQLDTPMEVNWDLKEGVPFLNSSEFLYDNTMFDPIINEHEVTCDWQMDANNELLKKVDIFIKEKIIARLEPGSLPGWSTLVKKDGPLAKVLCTEIR